MTHSLAKIEAHAAEKGIDESNVFSVTGRATLKVVGESCSHNEPGDGVGNNIGHVYNDDISRQIAEIGHKLGGRWHCAEGRAGLAADLIHRQQGKVWNQPEINDRQQGPTDQMSADAENEGLPGLSQAWPGSHITPTFKGKGTSTLLAAAQRYTRPLIHQQYTQSAPRLHQGFRTHERGNAMARLWRKKPDARRLQPQEKDGAWNWGQGWTKREGATDDLSSGVHHADDTRRGL